MKGDHERVKRFKGEIKERVTEHTRHEALRKLEAVGGKETKEKAGQ